MKQAQNVAQAVARRPSLAAWSCMGPRRRNVTSTVSYKGMEESSASDKEKVDQSCGVVAVDCSSTSAAGEITTDGGEGQQSAGKHESMISF